MDNPEARIKEISSQYQFLMYRGYFPIAPMLTHYTLKDNAEFDREDYQKSYTYHLKVCSVVYRIKGESKTCDYIESLAKKLSIPVVTDLAGLEDFKKNLFL